MSSATDVNVDPALHAHGDTHGHGSRRSYLLGFLFSVVLTAVPFWLVMSEPVASRGVIAAVVIVAAIAQILVHTVAFLHVNTQGEGGWTLLAYVFTGVIVLITILGSLWIMYHLNGNMMPGMMSGQVSNTP